MKEWFQSLLSADLAVENWVTVHRDLDLTQVFMWITQLGNVYAISALFVFSFLVLLSMRKRVEALCLAGSLLACFLSTYFLKYELERPRPEHAFYLETSFSFPSGHASMSVVLYGMLAYLLVKRFKKMRQKMLVIVPSVLLVLLIGASRIYLDVHYLSDVLGGLLLGSIFLSLGIFFDRRACKMNVWKS